MNYQGSCVAIYSTHAYLNILKVVKYLRSVDYSDSQLSVIGRRANGTRVKYRFLGLFKSFKYKKAEKYFWDNLKDLLRGGANFKTSEDYYIDVMGELSQPNLKTNMTEYLTENIHDSYADITNLLHFVGIPKVSFEHYKTLLKNDQLLLIIHGNYQELKRAANLLDLSGNINVSLHLENTS
ncbi:MAG: hypothetical protein V7749_03120 [Cocleimonas sp.]